jgi:glycosyltransferase involved in cell wall biosynthesis
MLPSSDPLVSVVIPVRDGEAFVADAIDSVCGQTIDDLEVIVVDDGSTDNSFAIAASHVDGRTRAVRQAATGAAAARNHGARLARGEWLAFLDADDLWMPDKLRLQMQVLEQAPSATMVFGHVQEFLSPEFAATGGQLAIPRLLPGYSVVTLLVRRRDFAATGDFDERLMTGEFADWYDRARAAGLEPMLLPDTLTRRRIHAGNLHRRRRADSQGYPAMLKAILDRRRRSGDAA